MADLATAPAVEKAPALPPKVLADAMGVAPAEAPVEEGTDGVVGGGTPESAQKAFGHFAEDAPKDDGAHTHQKPVAELSQITWSTPGAINTFREQLRRVAPEERARLLATLSPEAQAIGWSTMGLVTADDINVAKIADLAGYVHDVDDDEAFAEQDRAQQESRRKDLAKALQAIPEDQRDAIVAEVATKGGTDGELRGDQIAATQAARAEATQLDKDAAEHKAMIATNVEASEKAVAAGDTKALTATLDGLRGSAREKALEQMTPDARKAADEVLAVRRKKLEAKAEMLREASKGGGTNEVDILKGLSGLTPTEASELEDIYGEKYKDGKSSRSLRADLKGEFDKDDKETKLIEAVLDGNEEAKQLSVELTVDYIHGEKNATFNTSETDINELMRAHVGDAEALKMIGTAYKAKSGKPMTEDMKEVMNEGQLKENTAYQRNDLGSANVAILQQGKDDRSAMVIKEARATPGGMKTLVTDLKEHEGGDIETIANEHLPPDLAASVIVEGRSIEADITEARDKKLHAALEDLKTKPEELKGAQEKARLIASKLATAISQPHVAGNNVDVTEPLRGLSPAEVALVMDNYRAQDKSGDADLEKDLRSKLTGKDLKVANAALSGDKVLSAVAFFEQGADGIGTNVEGMKKALDSLTTEDERKAFLAKVDAHVGGVDGSATADLIRTETSSYDRDGLTARAIVDTDRRAASIAQVDVTKRAYGGKLAVALEGFHDTVGDLTGETDEHRNEYRHSARENNLVTIISNFGGDEDGELDAVANLNDKQMDLFHEEMLLKNKETAEATFAGEMSGPHLDAANKFLAKDHIGGTAERMVAEMHCYVNDRENEASLPFENPRLSPEALKSVASAKTPEAQATALEEEKAKARAALLVEADKAARTAGHEGGYIEMLENQLTPSQLAVAKDRIATGKVSDVNALFEAGQTNFMGLGKDPSKFYEVMEKKTPAEMEKFSTEFEAAHGVPLKDWVKKKATSAGETRDFDILLEGNYARMDDKELAAKAASRPEELIRRVKDLHAAATGGAEDSKYNLFSNAKNKITNEIGNAMTGASSNIDERIDGRLKAVTDLEAKLARGEPLSSEEQRSLIDDMRFMSGDQKSYTESKTAVTGVAAEVGGKAVEYATVATTGSTAVGALAGGAVEADMRGALDGGRFGVDQQVSKVIEVGGDAVLGAVGDKLEKIPLAGKVFEGAGGSWVSAAANMRNLTDGGDFAAAGGAGMLDGAATAVMSAGNEKVFGKGTVGAVADVATKQMISGDPSKSFGDQLAIIAKNAVGKAATNHAKASHSAKHPPRPAADAKKPDAKPDARIETSVLDAKETNDNSESGKDKTENGPAVNGDPDSPTIEVRDADDATRAEVEAAERAAVARHERRRAMAMRKDLGPRTEVTKTDEATLDKVNAAVDAEDRVREEEDEVAPAGLDTPRSKSTAPTPADAVIEALTNFSERSGMIVDHLANDKTAPMEATPDLSLLKTGGDAVTIGIAAIDVVSHLFDPSKKMSDVKEASLGNAVVAAGTFAVEKYLDTKMPGMGMLFAKSVDTGKMVASQTMPFLMERVGGSLKALLAGNDREAIRLISTAFEVGASKEMQTVAPSSNERDDSLTAEDREELRSWFRR